MHRPENLELVDETAGTREARPEENALPGEIVDVAPLGADMHIVVRIAGDHRLLAVRKNMASSAPLIKGQSIAISPSDVLVF